MYTSSDEFTEISILISSADDRDLNQVRIRFATSVSLQGRQTRAGGDWEWTKKDMATVGIDDQKANKTTISEH